MKKLFVIMMVALFGGAVAVGCSSEDDAEATEISSGSEYTEDQWGTAEQQGEQAMEETGEAMEETGEAMEESAEESAEELDEEIE